jgi:hypothetical protein
MYGPRRAGVLNAEPGVGRAALDLVRLNSAAEEDKEDRKTRVDSASVAMLRYRSHALKAWPLFADGFREW